MRHAVTCVVGAWRSVAAVSARRIAALLSIAALAGIVLAPVGDSAPPGLLVALGFDEGSGTTVADASGNGNTGTTANTTWASSGKYGKALSFNGTSSRVTVPDKASLRLTTAMTLEAWVHPTVSPRAWRDVMMKGNANYYLSASTSKGGRPGAGATIGGSRNEAFGPTPLPTNTWSHLAVTYNGTAVRLYVNGTLVNTTTKTGAITTSTNALSIGSDSFYGQYFNGRLDEIRIYDTALTQAQIQTDMATPITGTPPDSQQPSAPGTLIATVINGGRIDLSWGAATDNVAVTGYRVERCQGAGCSGFTQIAATGATTGYNDTTVAASETYSYRVRATDAAGNLGPYTGTATATTSDTQQPSAPGTLAATVINGGRIDLSWDAATDNVAVTGYRVERCQGAGCSGFTQIAATGATTGYNDTTVAASQTYSYRVRATDAAGNLGPYTGTATATTPPVGGPTPGLLVALGFDEGSGTTVADSSGKGNAGTTANTTWASSGKYGNALSFNGASSRVTVPDTPSLRLTSAMTLEAWVNPTVALGSWRDVMMKGNDNYYLSASTGNGGRPGAGAIIGGSSGKAFGPTPLPVNTWNHLAVTYDGSAVRFYVNGTLAQTTPKTGAITTSTNALTIGSDSFYGQYFNGRLDEIRIYDTALTQTQIQIDMTTPIAVLPSDQVPPTIEITSPTGSAQVADIVDVTANADDDTGVAGVQFRVDGVPNGIEDPTAPWGLSWDTRTVGNGAHTLTAIARDAAGNVTTSAPVIVNVANTNSFQNEVLATGFALPTSIEFLPDGRMLVVELAGRIKVLPPPYTQADPVPFLQLSNVGAAGVQQGIYDVALDPNFVSNRFYYVFYTLGTPNRDRLSRFTANATLNGTVAGSETVLYQDPVDAHAEHHGGAIVFGNDGKLYFTTGEHFNPSVAPLLSNPRGKIHRINPDGTVPTDNPFVDGAGSNVDSIWARGLRNPFRAFYDSPTGRMFVADVGGNDYVTAFEEVNIGAAGANYAWPNCEGICGGGQYSDPLYAYPHSGRDASITGGFVYRGTQFPSAYVGSYFFADYTQNWIKRLTFDATGNVSGVHDFEPINGAVDGPYGDIVYLTEGPDGAVYYVDLGYSDIGGTFGVSKIRRIRYVQSNQAPVVVVAATPTSGPTPLDVAFSSTGTLDPEGQPLTYAWTFGDGSTATAAHPTHTYAQLGQYTARLSVSDGVNTTQSTPIVISVGGSPTPTILTPVSGTSFQAGDVISFSGDATDPEDGALPDGAFTWSIDFLHEGHVHPGIPQSGVKSGTFTIPSAGHDFSGNTRYRVALTVTDSDGLTATTSVVVTPQKVNLTFDTAPSGLTLYFDGIAKVTPFVVDTLIGFQHTIEARDQGAGTTSYEFGSWSDGGAQQHTVVAPSTNTSYTATYVAGQAPATPTFVQVASSTPQTPESAAGTTFGQPQTAGNLNVVVIGWNNATSNVMSVTDTAGNSYAVAAPTTRNGVISQAIYYARNIAPGPNTVNVTFDASTPYVDVRIAEYAGLDPVNPFDATASAGGSGGGQPSSGAVTTTAAVELLVGAGTTSGVFSAAGTGYTLRIITWPDSDILEDQVVTSTGSYAATAIHPFGSWWVMQLVTFRAAGT